MPEGDLRNDGSGAVFMLKIIVVLFLCLLLCQPQKGMEGAKEGLLLWYNVVLPSQLPFVMGVRLLLKTAPLTKIPTCLLGFILGLVAGYPVGSMTTAQLYKQGRISRRNLTQLAAFNNMAGPLFVVGTVGIGLLGSARCGYCLLVVHWISAAMFVIFPALRESRAQYVRSAEIAASQKASIGRMMGDAVGETAELMLKIGGFIVLFSVLRQWVSGAGGALMEMTGGISWLAEQNLNLKWKLVGCSFLINFSGICILLQSLEAAGDAPVSARGFIGCKLMQGVAAAGIMFGICQFLRM